MVRDIWPYLRAQPGTVTFAPWVRPESGAPLPEYLEGWDPQTDVVIERVVECDLDAVRSDTGLDADVPLMLSVNWTSNQSYMTESLFRAPLESKSDVRVVLPSARLDGAVTVRTSITVATTDTSRALGRAKWAGSILVHDDQRIVLEGSGPMLPLAEQDFAATPLSPDGSWVLQLPEDLSLPVLGAVLLLVNSRDEELVAALSTGIPDPRQTALLEALEGQVAAHLIAQATERADEIRAEDWDEETVGDLLTRYLTISTANTIVTTAATGDAGLLAAALDGAARGAGFGRSFL
ncbi:MAG TPA: hypothetical protein VIQ11_11900 [Mycobacterium sp.]